MKKLMTMALMASAVMLSGCAGFLGLECKSMKYVVGSKHEALSQCISARAKGYDSRMVVAKKGDNLTAWCEVNGVPVMRTGSPRRLLPNPMWPFKMLEATKRGTPRELGLIKPVGPQDQTRWLLFTSENERIIGHYEACKAMYDSAVVATDGKSYWLEVTVDGKVYAETTRQGHFDHYDKAVSKGWTVVWSGNLAEYEVLASMPVSAEKQEASRKASRASLAGVNGWYWRFK